MLLNLILLLLVLGPARSRQYGYYAALALGLLKGTLYGVFPLMNGEPAVASVLNGVIGFAIFGGLGAGVVWLVRRLNRGEAASSAYPAPSERRAAFRWEYLPLGLIVVLIIGGESIAALVLDAGGAPGP